ncbi:MAG: tyrosine-type recombinase/integrase [Candidatus Hodarchaeota archaeon]
MSDQEPIVIGDLNLGDNQAILEEFLELNPLQVKTLTLKNYRSIIGFLITWLKDKHIFELTTRDFLKYQNTIIKDSGIGYYTKKMRIAMTKKFLRKVYNLYLEEISEVRKPIVIIQFLNFLNEETKVSKEVKSKKGREHYYMTKKEIELFFKELKIMDYQKYLMFRLYLETGCRRIGITNLQLDPEKPFEYYLARNELCITRSKTKEFYYLMDDLKDRLMEYVIKRRKVATDKGEVFLSIRGSKYNKDTINMFCKRFIAKVNKRHGKEVLSKKITPHAFRRTLNNLRLKMGCNDKNLKILLCQKVEDVNFNHYQDKSNGFFELYKKYYPFDLYKL